MQSGIRGLTREQLFVLNPYQYPNHQIINRKIWALIDSVERERERENKIKNRLGLI
jgi:hypothetical protein